MDDTLDAPGSGSPLDRLAALFAEVVESGDPRARATALLTSLRVQDPALALQLGELLAAHDVHDEFLDEPIVAEAAAIMTTHLDGALVGSRVGMWEVDAVLHHGGMGTVYRAHRVDVDFEQHAALKVIKVGLQNPGLVRRFAQERRLLARLEHPNIARLLDGGTTPEGLPYLVMEYVQGETIDGWCARERPSHGTLLEVFGQICAAVDFAHQNLVVHQDIKPSNVLVTPEGIAKLVDFGIADLERQAVDLSSSDETSGPLLTPDYASPEQFRGDGARTTTDTYALGVLLYRLLTGEAPYHVPPGSTREVAERFVLDTIPGPPSRVMKARGMPLPRRAEDLDAIVLRALEKHPADRYPSVQALAQDLRRCVAGFPVHARPATVMYRATRFIGRNVAALVVAATIAGLLVAGLSAALWQAGVAERQRDLARAEASTAASAVEFLKTVLGSANPWRDAEPAQSVDDVIRIAETQLDSVMHDEPAARAYILSALGEVAAGRGELDRADRLTGAAIATLEQSVEEENTQAGAIYLARSIALHEDGRLDEARSLAARAVENLEDRDTGDWQDLAGALNQLAAIDIERGDHLAAETTLRRAIALHTRNGERELLSLAAVYNNLAVTLASQPDRLDEAADTYTEAARLVERIGASAPRLATLLANQANVFRLLGRHEEAEATLRRAVGLMTASLGEDHQATLTAITSLGSLYEITGRFEQAIATLRAPLAAARVSLPPDHPTTSYIQNVLGTALCQQDDPVKQREGLALAQASLASRRTAMGADHWAVASGEAIVGYCLTSLGRGDEGTSLLTHAIGVLRTQRGEDHELTLRARQWLERAP